MAGTTAATTRRRTAIGIIIIIVVTIIINIFTIIIITISIHNSNCNGWEIGARRHARHVFFRLNSGINGNAGSLCECGIQSSSRQNLKFACVTSSVLKDSQGVSMVVIVVALASCKNFQQLCTGGLNPPFLAYELAGALVAQIYTAACNTLRLVEIMAA